MKAPRRWISAELLLRSLGDEEPTGYRSAPGGRVEPAPNGHEETQVGEWRDGADRPTTTHGLMVDMAASLEGGKGSILPGRAPGDLSA